jgi:DNA-binding LacI/PurR family transcriptional regulator
MSEQPFVETARKKSIHTLVDLARLAGVSPGTVSRALANSPLISPETRTRIQALAQEHDFRINTLARNLRTRKTGAIGVVLPLGHEREQHISDPFFMTLLGHLADCLTERGYDLLLSRVIPKDERWLEALTQGGRVDGVLLIGQSDQSHVIDKVAQTYLPMVVWGARLPSAQHCTVGSNNALGGALAAQHLIALGCQKIAFFGDPQAPEFAQRLAGCEQAVQAAGLAPAAPILPVHLTALSAQATISTYLQAGPIPDGIVCASDIIAMSAIHALIERGIKVPEQVCVVGYDDLSIAAQTTPPLTTVRQDIELGAKTMVDLLFKRMAGVQTQSVEFTPKLICRRSTRALRAPTHR